MGSTHTLNIEVFYADYIIAKNQLGSQLVNGIVSLIGNTFLQPSYFASLIAIATAL